MSMDNFKNSKVLSNFNIFDSYRQTITLIQQHQRDLSCVFTRVSHYSSYYSAITAFITALITAPVLWLSKIL